MGRHERGISLMGFIFVTVVVVVVALIGFRVLPAYIEYYSVQKALQTSLDEAPTGNLAEVRRAFDRKLSASYVESVRPTDIQVNRQGNTITASIAWQRVLHMVGNASILLEFDATASR
jgi:hypothetical protein